MGNRPKKDSVRRLLKETLRRLAARERGGAKALASAADVTGRTAEGWLYDETAPGTAQTLALAAHYDEVWELVCLMTGRQPVGLTRRQRDELVRLLRLTQEVAG